MSYDISTSPLQYGAAVASGLLFGAAVFAKRLRTPKSAAPPASRSGLSVIGIVIQSASFFIAAFGRLRRHTKSDRIKVKMNFCSGKGPENQSG